ncbi:MAG: FdhF/YdeP family oxidoreductase [Phycisphaerales bacterium]|nr:FdhF/YdeP family oxidoreductase [Phycisphaerales bacterium]
MARRKIPAHGGGWPAIFYTLKQARAAGGLRRMWKALRSRNACKTCALGMGGQRGGMVDEAGQFPEVCKKSVQAMAADLQGAVPEDVLAQLTFERMQGLTPRELEHLGRITTPLYAGGLNDKLRPVSWDEAIDKAVAAIDRTSPERSFYYFSGRSSNEAGFLLQLMARMLGTNNINNCSYYCHQASGVGLASVTGSGTATVDLPDLDACDLVVLIGANPASNHPRFMKHLMQVKRNGGKVVVVNTLRERGLERFKVPSDVRSMLRATRIADLYIQPSLGGDALMLTGLVKAVIEQGAIDRAFIDRATEGWDEFEEVVRATSWDTIERSGVDRETIEQLAQLYAASKGTIFAWAMGVTHHAHGVDTVRLIANAAIARGMLGRKGAGLLPLRGHSNVQGIGSVGVVPKLKDAFFEALQTSTGIELPQSKGLDTMGCMEAAHRGEMDVAVLLGGNLHGSNPDATFAAEALQRIGTVIQLSTTFNTGHAWGRGREMIVFPVLARDEEPQSTTQESMFNYVRLSDGGKPRHDGPRAETEIIASLGSRLMGETAPINWDVLGDHDEIRTLLGSVVPGYEPVSNIGASRAEFQIEHRTFHDEKFPTASGRCRVHPVEAAEPTPLGERQVRIATIRSEGQFNTVVYETHDFYRGQERRDVILLNADDMRQMEIAEDQQVTVRTQTGELTVVARRYDLPPGNAAMYYPEANVLVPRTSDPLSRTPAFKGVVATIDP